MAENKLVSWTKDQLGDWLIGKVGLVAVPLVTALIYALWAYLKGPLGPEVFLGILVAMMLPTVTFAAIRAFRELEKGRTALEDIRTLILANEETRSKPVLAPTVEMLENGRREMQRKHENLVANWRAMVTEVHAKKQADRSRSGR